ncbi:MAG: anti-sigma factor antagonist [Rhizobiales bacterium]|nr:anti-sigma factor antagonist [Hyphomicrobiales bacterium]
MEISARHHQDILILDMVGRLDSSTSGRAYDTTIDIAKGGAKRIVLNLDKLEYVSSAGMRVILTLAKLLQSSAGEVKICHANLNVKEALETSGFNSLVKIFGDEQSAIASWDQAT